MDWLTDPDINTIQFIFNSKSDYIETYFQDDSGLWMLYNGQHIYWIAGKYGSSDRILASFNASSGFSNFQKAEYSNVKNLGPVPEGKYWVLLAPDPSRIAKASKITGELLPHPKGGIERIPKTTLSSDGREWVYTAWGTIRARLSPDRSTNTQGRSHFYLHDSTKGYSHGCIEVDHRLFDKLIRARNKFTKIALMVKYSSPETITKGQTFRP